VRGGWRGGNRKTAIGEERYIAQELSPLKKEAFPIVGIGSSAGGFEALISLFSCASQRSMTPEPKILATLGAIYPGMIAEDLRFPLTKFRYLRSIELF
jgi:hypothetical protein